MNASRSEVEKFTNLKVMFIHLFDPRTSHSHLDGPCLSGEVGASTSYMHRTTRGQTNSHNSPRNRGPRSSVTDSPLRRAEQAKSFPFPWARRPAWHPAQSLV